MFGLQNFKGSCWVNACIQGIFRIPEVQTRYSEGIFEQGNVLDECLCKIWKTQGQEGIKEFFQSVKTILNSDFMLFLIIINIPNNVFKFIFRINFIY